MATADASAPERAPVRGHPALFLLPRRGRLSSAGLQACRECAPPGSCPRTAHSGARRKAMATADASAPERASVRGHPALFLLLPRGRLSSAGLQACRECAPPGSCPRTAHSGAGRKAMVTADASAPERASVRGHPALFLLLPRGRLSSAGLQACRECRATG